jgi:hypothetical protein
MLSGVTTRWKQTCAYYFTPASVDGSVLKEIICNIITKAEQIGLKVIAITSDMGSANQRMWREFGISVTNGNMTTSVGHPYDHSRQLHFIADPPHILKNVRNFMISGQKIQLDDATVAMHKLNHNEVSSEPITILHNTEKLSFSLKLAPKLTERVLKPGQNEGGSS